MTESRYKCAHTVTQFSTVYDSCVRERELIMSQCLVEVEDGECANPNTFHDFLGKLYPNQKVQYFGHTNKSFVPVLTFLL